MFEDGSWSDSDRWVDDWQGRIEERLARAHDLATRCGRLTGVAESGGGAVRVTVDSSGALIDLGLDEGVRRNSAR